MTSADVNGPAFLSPSGDRQAFHKQWGPRDLSVSFDITPAFMSTSEEVRQHFALHGYQAHQQEGQNDCVGVGAVPREHGRLPPGILDASPLPTTTGTTHSQGMLSNRGNVEFLRPVRPQAVDGNCLIIPNAVGIRQHADCQLVRFTYPSWEPSGCVLLDVMQDGFPHCENLRATVPHGTMLYCSEVGYWLSLSYSY